MQAKITHALPDVRDLRTSGNSCYQSPPFLRPRDQKKRRLWRREWTERRKKESRNLNPDLTAWVKINEAKLRRNQLKGCQAAVTKQFNKGAISEAERQENKKRIQNTNAVLGQYINYYETKVKTMKGSGIRKKRGGNVMFFNDPKHLLQKLEIIIGEIAAGNTSIKMRNMGVAILDMLLKTSAINKSQCNKLHKNYFSIQSN